MNDHQVFQNNDLHLMLLGHSDLATRLVTALENSLSGETKCAMETLKNYNEEVEKISESLDVSRLLHSKRLTVDKKRFDIEQLSFWNSCRLPVAFSSGKLALEQYQHRQKLSIPSMKRRSFQW